MRNLEKHLTKEYCAVKVFLNDLEEIENVLKEPGKEPVNVKTDEHSFSSIKELKEHHENQILKKLDFSRHNPYIHIEFAPDQIRLYSESDSTIASGIFYKLDSIISTTTRKPNFLYSLKFLWFVILLMYASPLLPEERIPKPIALFILIPFLLWYCYAAYIRLANSSKIILMRRHDLKGFFERNKDQIFVGSIVSVITFFFTLLINNNWESIQLFLKMAFKP